MTPPELRSFPIEVRERKNSRLRLRLATYGREYDLGAFTETLRPGCFSKSVREAARALPLMVVHNHRSLPIGKTVAWHDTEDTLEADYELDSRDEAREMARLIDEELLNGASIGFQPITDRWDHSGARPAVERVEARMVESSLTGVPAYPDAGVLALRSAGCVEIPGTAIVPTPRLLEARAWLSTLTGRP